MFEKNVSLTSGSVAKGMLVFAIPIFFSNLFQQLYNAVDSLIVGNFLGGNALAAVGSSGSLIFLLTGFVNGVSLGAGVLVARHYGAKDETALRRAFTGHTDERNTMITHRALRSAGLALCVLLYAGVFVVGLFAPVLFLFCLVGAIAYGLLFCFLRLYYSRKY